MEILRKPKSFIDLGEQLVRGFIREQHIPPVYNGSELLSTFEPENKSLGPINIYKIYTYPEIDPFWQDSLTRFYDNLSDSAKHARFNTTFRKLDNLTRQQQASLLGTSGKTISLVAIDPKSDEIVAHAQSYIVKKSEKRLQEVAITATSSPYYLRNGIALNLLKALIADAKDNKVEFLELYTNSSNQPVNKLNQKLIAECQLQNIEIVDKDAPNFSYLYLYIGDDFPKKQIETKVDLEKLRSTLTGDYLLTPEAQETRQNSSLNPLKVKNIDTLVLQRAQGVYLLAYFEEIYNQLYPKAPDDIEAKKPRKKSRFRFIKH